MASPDIKRDQLIIPISRPRVSRRWFLTRAVPGAVGTALALSTGLRPASPNVTPQYGYGQDPQVSTVPPSFDQSSNQIVSFQETGVGLALSTSQEAIPAAQNPAIINEAGPSAAAQETASGITKALDGSGLGGLFSRIRIINPDSRNEITYQLNPGGELVIGAFGKDRAVSYTLRAAGASLGLNPGHTEQAILFPKAFEDVYPQELATIRAAYQQASGRTLETASPSLRPDLIATVDTYLGMLPKKADRDALISYLRQIMAGGNQDSIRTAAVRYISGMTQLEGLQLPSNEFFAIAFEAGVEQAKANPGQLNEALNRHNY